MSGRHWLLREQAEFIRQEIGELGIRYSDLVQQGRMNQRFADRRLSLYNAVLATLLELQAKEFER